MEIVRRLDSEEVEEFQKSEVEKVIEKLMGRERESHRLVWMLDLIARFYLRTIHRHSHAVLGSLSGWLPVSVAT